MVEYKGKPREYITPSDAELAARKKRNFAIALGLSCFMVFVFFIMVSRGQVSWNA